MKKIYGFIWMNIGILLVAAGIVLFKIPNNFATGGVTGIAIIINRLKPSLSVGMLMLVLNIVLLIIGLIFTGFEFEIKTIYSTLVLSSVVWFLEETLPVKKPLTGDTMLELFIAIILLAAGSAILFYTNASAGGTDILAKIVNQKMHWHIGRAVLVFDFIIGIFAVLVFGLRIGLYSILGVIIKGFLIDAVIEGLHGSKQIIIISSRPEDIRKYIVDVLHRGVTIYRATGGKSNTEKQVLNTVMSSRESMKLREFVLQLDDKAFMVIDDVNDIYGLGFNRVEL